MSLYSELFYCQEVNWVFSDRNAIIAMLNVEAALAQSQATHGIFDTEYAKIIAGCCIPENIDISKLKKE